MQLSFINTPASYYCTNYKIEAVSHCNLGEMLTGTVMKQTLNVRCLNFYNQKHPEILEFCAFHHSKLLISQ